jgi:hypothetical protein
MILSLKPDIHICYIFVFLQDIETEENVEQEEYNYQDIKEETPLSEVLVTNPLSSMVRWSCRQVFFYKNIESCHF